MAPEMAAPPEALVTVPVMAPVVGAAVRLKLADCVTPAVTVATWDCELKPVAAAVRVWLPGANPLRV